MADKFKDLVNDFGDNFVPRPLYNKTEEALQESIGIIKSMKDCINTLKIEMTKNKHDYTNYQYAEGISMEAQAFITKHKEKD